MKGVYLQIYGNGLQKEHKNKKNSCQYVNLCYNK